ncbi:MAG: YlzJ-like family protein [Bacillota bacterium]|nr:YlzJ-like family protein [Bacillota bacterium]
MILYTILPPEEIFAEEWGEEAAAPVEVQVDGVILSVSPGGNGSARVERVISTNPEDYLHPFFQPGSPVFLAGRDP